jgi:CelD/BcsL family acetyltransferase involved in cellulose biosynthesis
LLTAPANTTPLVKQLAHWLDGVFQKEWDAIDLDQVDPNDPALSALVEDLGQRGHNVHQRPGLNCWRIALPESWDAYLASLSRHRRERVRQLWRKSYESKKAVLRQAKTSAELDQAWPILTDLHQRRRRSLGQPGCFASPTFASFLRDASEQLLAVDHTQLTWVEYEGQPAAAGLDFLGDQTLYCYQMGMNPDLMAIEPGNLRMVGRLRSAIESGYQTFDLLRGDEPYKAAWQGQPVPLVRWRIANRRLASRCRHRVWLGNEVAKQCVKDVRDRKRERKLENKPGNQTSHPAAKPESTT